MSFKQLKKDPLHVFTDTYVLFLLDTEQNVFVCRRFSLLLDLHRSIIYAYFRSLFRHIYSFHQLVFATYCHQTNSRRCLRAVGHRLSQARNSRSRSQCLRGVIIYPHVVYISRVFPSTGFQASPSFLTFPYCFLKKPYYPYFLVKIVGEII